MSTTSSSYKAIVLTEPNPSGAPKISIDTKPTPTPTSGQALVRVLSFHVAGGVSALWNGSFAAFLHTFPLVPGGGAVGRVEAVGPDAVSLKPGQLVVIDSAIRGRDAPEEKIVLGAIQGLSAGAASLATNAWRDGVSAQKVLVPLESVTPVDEDVLVKKRGYSFEQIYQANRYSLPFEAFRRVGLTAGETVIIAWGTGGLGNASTELALALGAGRVIALGRDAAKLSAWADTYPAHLRERIATFTPTGVTADDTAALLALTPRGKGANIFLDLSPPMMAWTPVPEGKETHFKAAIGALAIKGRIIFSGWLPSEVPVSYIDFIRKDLTLVGGFMYQADAPWKVYRMLEAGLLDTTEKAGYKSKTFEGLESIHDALQYATENQGTRFQVHLRP